MLREIGDRQNILWALALLARFAADSEDLYAAGVIWGAVETETARAPVYWWLHVAPDPDILRSMWANPALSRTSPTFEEGRSEVCLLTFDAALDFAAGGPGHERQHDQAGRAPVLPP